MFQTMTKWTLLTAAILLMSCILKDEQRFCAIDTACATTSNPFCDIDGAIAGLGHTCVPIPSSAQTCQSDNPCTGTDPLCHPEGFCTQCWNAAPDGNQEQANAACLNKDATTPTCSDNGACVCSDTSCTGSLPFCGDDGQCRGCIEDAECGSGICDIDNAECVDEGEVAYVTTGGSGSVCTQNAPCSSLDVAKDVMRLWILIGGGSFNDAGGTTFAEDVNIVGEDGAIYESPITLNVAGKTLKIRNLRSSGAGISASGGGSLELREVVIEGSSGAGISASGGGSLVVSRSIVRGNGEGGLQLTGVSFQIVNSLIVGNQDSAGVHAGLYILTGVTTSPQEIFFSTIADNAGDNIDCGATSNVNIDSSIIWNGPITDLTTKCVIANSTIPSGAAGNNIDDDPLFVDKINYELSQNSPAIDKGDTQTLTDNNITTDLDGTLRPQGTAPDMGAQEFAE